MVEQRIEGNKVKLSIANDHELFFGSALRGLNPAGHHTGRRALILTRVVLAFTSLK